LNCGNLICIEAFKLFSFLRVKNSLENTTLGEGWGNSFMMFLNEGRIKEIARMLEIPFLSDSGTGVEIIPSGQAGYTCEYLWKKISGKPNSGKRVMAK